jgi:hypothetical protein
MEPIPHSRQRQRHLLLLLLLVATGSFHPQHSSSDLLLPGAAAASADAPQELQSEIMAASVGPVWRKPGNVSAKSADAVAPAWVAMRYRAPGQGPCGRWDNFDYRDDRNNYPTRYCPRSCRVVSKSVAGCQCVTRASLNAFYSGRRWGQWRYPECCYLRPPGGVGGGGNCGGGVWGGGVEGGCPPPADDSGGGGGAPPPTTPFPGPPTAPTPQAANSIQFQLYTIGSCSSGALNIVNQNLRAFLATLPGVVGSSVEIATSAQIQTLGSASTVVAASLNKATNYVRQQREQASRNGTITAQTLSSTPKLPPQINVRHGGGSLPLPLAGRGNSPGGGGSTGRESVSATCSRVLFV